MFKFCFTQNIGSDIVAAVRRAVALERSLPETALKPYGAPRAAAYLCTLIAKRPAERLGPIEGGDPVGR